MAKRQTSKRPVVKTARFKGTDPKRAPRTKKTGLNEPAMLAPELPALQPELPAATVRWNLPTKRTPGQ